MADDRHYVPGDFYRIDDRTGFKIRAKNSRMQWNNLIVSPKVWEIRQPQDFVKGVVDDQTVPLPRPRSVSAYDGPLHTFITVAANIHDTLLSVNSSERMYAGDQIELVLDNGDLLQTMIVQVPDTLHIRIQDPLPWTAAVNNDLSNKSAVSPPNINY